MSFVCEGVQAGMLSGSLRAFHLARGYSFDMKEESKNIWDAMQAVFAAGFSTSDLSKPGSGVTMLSTSEFGDKVVEHLQNNS